MSQEEIEIGMGNDYRVLLDQRDERKVIKRPRLDSGHAIQDQAKYDTRLLTGYFSSSTVGDVAFHSTGNNEKDFYLQQLKTEERTLVTLDVLRDYKRQFLDILESNQEMLGERGVSLDFFGFLCCRPELWSPHGDTLLSHNLSVSADRGLIVEDTGLLHIHKKTPVRLTAERRFLYTIHHKIEQLLLSKILKKI